MIVATFIKTQVSKATGLRRNLWSLSGSTELIDKVLESKNSAFTRKPSSDGKTLITAPWRGPVLKGTVCHLKHIEDDDRWTIDSDDQLTALNNLKGINTDEIMDGVSDSVKRQMEQDILDDSPFSRARMRPSRFSSAPQPTVQPEAEPAEEPVPEPSADTAEADLDQPLEETPKGKAKANK